MTKLFKFTAKGAMSLLLPKPVRVITRVVGGVTTQEYVTPGNIEFRNGVFQTTKMDEVELIRKSPLFKSGEIIEIIPSEEVKPKKPVPVTIVATSKNDMLLYLLTEKNAPADVIKNYDEDQLRSYAKDQYLVTFAQSATGNEEQKGNDDQKTGKGKNGKGKSSDKTEQGQESSGPAGV